MDQRTLFRLIERQRSTIY